MATYAKYADMYRQRLARSQDARLELSGNVSPVRSQSAAKQQFNLANQTTLTGVQSYQGINGQMATRESLVMQAPASIHSMGSPRSQRPTNNRGIASSQPDLIPSHVRLAQDRSAYMTFLEVQLERVNAACANAGASQERIDNVQVQLNGQDEKITNIGRLVKLLQSFSEAQEEDVGTLKLSMRNLAMRLEEVVLAQNQQQSTAQHAGFFQNNLNDHQQQPHMVPQETIHSATVYESGSQQQPFGGGHATSVSPSNRSNNRSNKKSLSKSKSKSPHRSIQQAQSSSLMHQTNSFGTLEQHNQQHNANNAPSINQQSKSGANNNVQQMRDDLNNFASEVDRQMREVEARIVTNLSQHVEESNMHTNAKIDEALILLDSKIQRVEQMSSATNQRPNVIQSTQIVEDGRINPAKMEAALNDWLSKVEEQVNQIEEQVNSRAASIDLRNLERHILDTAEEKELRFIQLEQYCQRMCEQSNSRYEEVQERSLDWEDRFLQIQRHVEQTLNDQSRSIDQPTTGKAGSLLQSGLTTSAFGDGFDLSSVRTLEKKLAKRLGEGVERLGHIIKDLAKAQRKLDTRTCNLELKVLGQAKGRNNNETSNATAAVIKKKVVAKGQEILTQSGKGNSKKVSGLQVNNKSLKTSGVMLKNSNSAKSPAFKPQSLRRQSQKSCSPPVKDAAQGRVDRKASGSQRRSQSKTSMQARQNTSGPTEMLERPRSGSARKMKGSLNNLKTSFEQRLLQDGGAEEPSPREILRRARDRSIRELSASFCDSRSRSPNSQRLQSMVDIEQASPHQHRVSSISAYQQDSTLIPPSNHHISILNGPASGQKNIVAQNMTQIVSAARDYELEEIREQTNRGSGLHTGREYMTHPSDLEPKRVKKRMSVDRPESIQKVRKSSAASRGSAQRSTSKGRLQSRSASREKSRDKGGYTLKELEKREKSLQRKLAVKKQDQDQHDVRRGRTFNTSRNNSKNNVVVDSKSQERSLSQRTFQKMNVVGQNTVMAGHRGSNATGPRASNHDISYGSNNPSFRNKSNKKKKQVDATNGTISPNKTTGQMKTTKSLVPVPISHPAPQRQRSAGRGIAKGARVRSRSAAALSENSEPRVTRPMPAGHRINQTAAQEIFNQPFPDYHQSSQSQLPAPNQFNSRKSSNNPNHFYNHMGSIDQQTGTLQPKNSSTKRQRSISIEHSREEKRSLNATADNLGKKRNSLAKNGTPASSRKGGATKQSDTNTSLLGAASKTAKQKLKNLQNKKSNQRLMKLEKMYQELTDIEAKTAKQI